MYRKGRYRKLHFTGSTVLEAKLPRGKEKRHPTEKPVSMIEHIVRCSTLENEVCLDPFMGSCPVGEACMKAGRQFVGAEIEEKVVHGVTGQDQGGVKCMKMLFKLTGKERDG